VSVSRKAAEAYELFKKIKEIRKYKKDIEEIIDEDTRPGTLFKLSIEVTLKIAGKAIGTSLTSHPYFTYHKAHIEALAKALNASSNKDKAIEALNAAIRSADAAQSLTKALADYQYRKTGLKLKYKMTIEDSIWALRNRGTNAEAAKAIAESGLSPDAFQSQLDQNVYEWRAEWCDVYRDSVELLAMADVELRATEAAMKKYEEKMKAMASGGNIGRIAGYATEQERQWQEYDRMTKPGSGSEKAVSDPTGYTRDQVSSIEDVADTLGIGCAAAMSDDAYNPDMIRHKIGNL
jgi:hypothetical protein